MDLNREINFPFCKKTVLSHFKHRVLTQLIDKFCETCSSLLSYTSIVRPALADNVSVVKYKVYHHHHHNFVIRITIYMHHEHIRIDKAKVVACIRI
jgi:hypothetical protein